MPEAPYENQTGFQIHTHAINVNVLLLQPCIITTWLVPASFVEIAFVYVQEHHLKYQGSCCNVVFAVCLFTTLRHSGVSYKCALAYEA